MPDTALATIDRSTGELIEQPSAIALTREPTETLGDAQRCAKALQDVIRKKARPVMFNGEQYLEFEDWQTIGAFHQVTAKTDHVEPFTLQGVFGFRATAVAIDRHGRVLSRAEAFCMADEANWSRKPLFQLASMSQTRAMSKVLRNCFSWIVVLAGYQATPAEEFEVPSRETPRPRPTPPPPPPPPPAAASAPSRESRAPSDFISTQQQKRLFAIAKEKGWTEEQLRARLQLEGVTSSKQIRRAEYDALCASIERGPESAPTAPAFDVPQDDAPAAEREPGQDDEPLF